MSLIYVREIARLHSRMRTSFLTSPYSHGAVRIGLLRCADGRMRSFNRAMNIQPGMLFEMRAIGAKKDMASYPFRDRLVDWLGQGGRHYAMLLTYHFDCETPSLGCAGHGYDTQAARDAQVELAHDIKVGFRNRIHPIVAGYDTRLEEVVLHGEGGQTMRTSEIGDNRHQAMSSLIGLFPSIPMDILEQLIPLLLHNAQHVESNIGAGARTLIRDHQEVGVVIGRRVGWITDDPDALHAAIIEDTTLHPHTEISVGIQLLQSNLVAGRIPRDQGTFVMTCIPYFRKQDMKEASEVAARRWALMARQLVAKNAPEIASYITYLLAVICEDTRELTLLEGPPGARELFHRELVTVPTNGCGDTLVA
ncbi:MAG: hypothetical protein AAB403_20410 [Planctomycetota bacterium]